MKINLAEDGGAEFDQVKAQMLDALRKEGKAFFVCVAQDDGTFGWYARCDLDEVEDFLRGVSKSARAELADLARQAGVEG